MVLRKTLLSLLPLLLTRDILGGERETRFMVHLEPVKMVPLILGGVPAYRGDLSLVKDDKTVYTLKYSQFLTGHRMEEDIEKPGMTWYRVGGAKRIPFRASENGAFYELGVNLVYWNFVDTYYTYEFTGIQPMVYVGFQYIGSMFFSSLSVGAGSNLGSHKEKKVIDIDHELPPQIISNPPIALLGPYLPVDLEISLGVIF